MEGRLDDPLKTLFLIDMNMEPLNIPRGARNLDREAKIMLSVRLPGVAETTPNVIKGSSKVRRLWLDRNHAWG